MLAGAGAYPQRQRVHVVGNLARPRFDDADAAFARDERRVDVIQILVEKAAHQSFQNGGGDRVGLEVRRLTTEGERQFLGRVGDQLRGEPTQLFAERQMRSEYLEFLRGERRDVYR